MTISTSPTSMLMVDVDSLKKDPSFFYAPLVTVVVEQTAFRVPLEGLWKSAQLTEEHGLPPSDTPLSECEWTDPIELQNITADEFRGFLKLFIRSPLGCAERPAAEEELVHALKVAHLFRFDAVHSGAVARLDECDLTPARKLQLSQLYDVPAWYETELCRLAIRPESLSMEEAEQIGLATMTRLASLRDTKFKECFDFSKAKEPSKLRSFAQELKYNAGVRICEQVIEHCESKKGSEESESKHEELEEWKKKYEEKAKKARTQREQEADETAHKKIREALEAENRALKDALLKEKSRPSSGGLFGQPFSPKTGANTGSAGAGAGPGSTSKPFGSSPQAGGTSTPTGPSATKTSPPSSDTSAASSPAPLYSFGGGPKNNTTSAPPFSSPFTTGTGGSKEPSGMPCFNPDSKKPIFSFGSK